MTASGMPTTERFRFGRGERIIMCPISTCEFLRDRLGRRLIPSWRHQLNSPLLNLCNGLLAHIGQNEREVKDVRDGF